MTNTTGNGIFQSHGSFLTEGWPNDILWQLDFDVSFSAWSYVGMMPLCSEEINPYTDAKVNSYALCKWESFTYPTQGLNCSVVSQDPHTPDKTANKWHHVTIIKLTDTQIKVILDNEYEAILNVPNLQNIQTLHIGSRDNPASRNSGGIMSFKNIRVKAI